MATGTEAVRAVIARLLVRRVAVMLHSRALTSLNPRALDEPVVRSGSADAARVLLLGSGITSGWGVNTHGLALAGQLQQVLQARLQRPVDVEQVSAMGATLSRAPELLGDRAEEDWDAIVLAFGLSDAMRLTSDREWAQGLDRILAVLDGQMPAGDLVPIVVAGLPPTDAIGFMTPLVSIFRRRPERLNALSRAAVDRNRRCVFVPLEAMAGTGTRPEGSPEAYRAWAESLTDRLAPLLERIPAGATGSTPPGSGPVAPPPVTVPVAVEESEETPPSSRPRPLQLLRSRLRLGREGGELARTARRRSLPLDRDVRIQGPDPIRVLLVGGEYAVGWGTTDRAQALDGALAHLLHLRTGRGVTVENRSEHGVRLEQLAGSLGPAGAHTFDLVVWTPTFTECARPLVRSRTTAGVTMLLRRIRSTSDAAVVLMGVPSLLGAQPLAIVGRMRAQQIDRVLRAVARRYDRVLVAEPPPVALSRVEALAGAQVYAEAAVRVLPEAMRLLAPGAGPSAGSGRREPTRAARA